MKTTLYRQYKGNKPVIYEHFATKKAAKEMLVNIWQSTIETDDTTTIAAQIKNNGEMVITPNEIKYFIQPDKRL